jgi:hypothetical protein
MATAADIISKAFEKISVTVYTTAQETQALASLNYMVTLLGADKLMYSVTSESFSVVAGDAEYTVGTSGQWDTARPIGVASCFLRDADDYDWLVQIIASKDYRKYHNKAYLARPTELIFVPEYPLAKIIFNSVPPTNYDAYFEFQKNFSEFATTAANVALPPEYNEALVYNLAVSLSEDWGRNINQSVFAQAMRTRDVIKSLNAAARPVPRARFDLGGMGGNLEGVYDILTDERIDGGSF